ncbi:MAG: CDF family Co(II)/Ni(II) efflux transporter DmeF, partial [Aquificaceae bacterium]
MVCKHEHDFYTPEGRTQRKVLIVLLITLMTMLLEIVAGYVFNSVALLADGIHMATHALAFGIAYIAYYFAKRWSKERSFTFGTWKIEVLGGYTSGILLFFVSFLVLQEAFSKLIKGGETKYDEALFVALLGLGVNLLSAYLLYDGHHHEHTHHDHSHHHDLNLRGAYLHVLADALTSILAIGGLLSGKLLGLWFMDPIMGLVGFFLIVKWSIGLMKETASILLDREGKNPLVEQIIKAIEEDGKGRVYDIHLLRVGRNRYACILGIETEEDLSIEYYERIISNFENIAHATLELRLCPKGG